MSKQTKNVEEIKTASKKVTNSAVVIASQKEEMKKTSQPQNGKSVSKSDAKSDVKNAAKGSKLLFH